MNLAIREVTLNQDEDGDGAIGSISDDEDDANNPRLGTAVLQVQRTDEAGIITLLSQGNAARAHRQISLNVSGSGGESGLRGRYFDLGFFPSRLSQIDWEGAEDHQNVVALINWPGARDWGNPLWSGGPYFNYGAEFTGQLTIETAGSWRLSTESDDGSRLWIDDELVVDNDGLHGMRRRSGTVSLDAGTHTLTVQFFERAGNHGLIVSWQGPGVPSRTVIPADAYSH